MPTTLEALIVIGLVIAPGFLLTRMAAAVIAFEEKGSEWRFLLPTITSGTLLHAAWFGWTIDIVRYYQGGALVVEEHVWGWGGVVSWGLFVLVVSPIAAGAVIGRLANTRPVDSALSYLGLGFINRMPTAWEYAMRPKKGAWVKAHLQDGTIITGRFSKSSFAAEGSRDRPDLYIEDQWQLNGDGIPEYSMVDNGGVWIAPDTIRYIQFFNEPSPEGGAGVSTTTASGSGGQRNAGPSAEDRDRDHPSPANPAAVATHQQEGLAGRVQAHLRQFDPRIER